MIESPLNKTLFFDQPTHTYTNSKGEKLISVSTLVHKFEVAFDIDGKILKRCSEREGISEEELALRWRKAGDDACLLGSSVHAELEYYIINKKIKKDGLHKDIVKAFKKIGLKGELQSELVLASHENMLAGTLDLVQFISENTVRLKDFKTNRKLSKYCPYGNRMLPPFDRYFSHTFQKYTFQLNLYALLLEDAGVWVEDMEIYHINPKKATIETHTVPFIRKDAIKMMEAAKELAKTL